MLLISIFFGEDGETVLVTEVDGDGFCEQEEIGFEVCCLGLPGISRDVPEEGGKGLIAEDLNFFIAVEFFVEEDLEAFGGVIAADFRVADKFEKQFRMVDLFHFQPVFDAVPGILPGVGEGVVDGFPLLFGFFPCGAQVLR